jgi:hypothetical protein
MQFSPPSHYFILLGTKYSPQHLVFKHPQSKRSSFTLI